MVAKVINVLEAWSSRRQLGRVSEVRVKRVVSCRSAVNHGAALKNSNCLAGIIETHQ